jgi:predicted MPP superfamily phosphohydrolase
LLSHQPNFIDEINKKDGVNFVLAGHTHGVQISLFHYMPILPRRIARWQYRVGLVETPQARMLVSAGVGNAPPYFRFMAAPQIHLLTFKSVPRR